MIPFCQANGIGIIPFSPIARGFLSANRQLQENRTLRTLTDDYGQQVYGRSNDHRVFEAVDTIAKKRGVSPSQIALAWTAGKPGITAPIFGATSVQHIDEAVAALSIKLDTDESKLIETAYEARPIHASGH